MKNKITITSSVMVTLVALTLLCCTPRAGASILLSAEDFTLLGGTAITSTGVVGTVISNGNVGLSPGATTGITGFPPAVIENGAIIATGPVTGQARLDLIKVQSALALMSSDETLSADLGGMTLASGVYTFNGAATLNGALVLDGEGNDDAYWVFQIGTSFTASSSSTVTVINPGPNGGSDYGIFWNVGTTVIFGANNAILGNYLSGTSITFGSETSGSGRALALAAISLDQNAIDAFGGPGSSDWTGGLKYDQLGNIVPVPEPSTMVLIGLSILTFILIRRSPGPAMQKAYT